jgi:hypothetical protein
MSAPARPARRRFLQQSAAVTVAFSLWPVADSLAQPATLPGSLNTTPPDAWLRRRRRHRDGIHRQVDLGQASTALAQIVADD